MTMSELVFTRDVPGKGKRGQCACLQPRRDVSYSITLTILSIVVFFITKKCGLLEGVLRVVLICSM